MKVLKVLFAIISLVFFTIQPILGLDFIEYDSSSYYHGEMPSIKSVKADETAGLSITYVTLHQPINGCLNLFVGEDEYTCVNFIEGEGTVMNVSLPNMMTYAHLGSYNGDKVSK